MRHRRHTVELNKTVNTVLPIFPDVASALLNNLPWTDGHIIPTGKKNQLSALRNKLVKIQAQIHKAAF